ncbi:MAG: glycosyltransferase [Clostridia bacterium]|nr:glycosyltransferase [Clostridia bacterium]
MKKYSVIVPFHSNINLLTMCISTLQNTLDFYDSEIIVVDNNATGSQIKPELGLEKVCKIISRSENLMYPRAINLGVEYANGEFLIFCDADTCVTQGFQFALSKILEFEDIGYASAQLLNMQTNNLQEFGITSSYYNFPHPFAGRSRNYSLVKENHYPLAACAACSSIKRELYIDIGGFDNSLIHSYSDIDLCLQLKERGYKTACVADAVAYHCGASTIGSGMGASLKEDTKGIFTAKHPDIPIQIIEYIDKACNYFISTTKLKGKDYFVFDCSTIGNSELYINSVVNNLNLNEIIHYRQPYTQRDANKIDLINFIPHMIRNYKIPILYFVDSFLSCRENNLWKSCRENFDDIVIDRNANIELLRFI